MRLRVQGKCAITEQFLLAYEVRCHHIKPLKDGGTDKFNNLVVVHHEIEINRLRKTLRLFPIIFKR